MSKEITVQINKNLPEEISNVWFYKQAGSILKVKESKKNSSVYKLLGYKLYIRKQYCIVVSPVDHVQPEPNVINVHPSNQTKVDEFFSKVGYNPESKCKGDCGMNYCDDNGCIDRKRNLTNDLKLPHIENPK